MQLVNIVIIIAAIIAALPLIKTPACLVTLAYVAYLAFSPKSSSKILHPLIFVREEIYDDLINPICDDKKNEIISAWDEDDIAKHTSNLNMLKSFLPESILSSHIRQYSEDHISDYFVLINLAIISTVSIFITDHQLSCLIYSVINIVIHQNVFRGKIIAKVNVTNWENRSKFIKSIVNRHYMSGCETHVQKWISVQIKIAVAEQKIIPKIFKQINIHPERIAVRNGIKYEKDDSLSELIKENDRHLFRRNYDAVIVSTHENQSIYISNGYIEIPNSSVNLDVFGGDFIGKISRTYIKMLVTDDKIRTYDQCGKYTTKCQSEIIQIASACNLN